MLVQKGTQRIEVIVRKEGGLGDAGAGEKPLEEVSADTEKKDKNSIRTALFGSSSPQRQRRVILTNATHILAATKQGIQQMFTYTVGGIGYIHGDQALQDAVERNVEAIKDPVNIAAAGAMGAVYGAWGGPVGAFIGAFIGIGTTGLSTALKYKGRQRDYNYKIFKENNQIEYRRARANINLTTGRLR